MPTSQNFTPEPDNEQIIRDLWLDYKNNPTTMKQRALVERYTYIPRSIAYQFARKKPHVLDIDDLIQAGMVGLVQAMERYDPSKEVKFNTYATIRVRGAILDQINNVDWTPRPIRESIKKVIKAIEASGAGLTISENSDVDPKRISDLIDGMSVEDVKRTLEQMKKTYVSHIDKDSMSAIDLTVIGGPKDYSNLYAVMNTVLDLRERQLIELKFFGGYKDYEIIKYLKMSQHQLNAMEKQALDKLSHNLNSNDTY